MYVKDIAVGYTMGMPLQSISGLGADFDGDTLNILSIINKDFQAAAEKCFNPRNAMYISKNDGYFNNAYNHQRDTLINANTLINLSREKYTPEQLEAIKAAKRAV